MFKRSIDSSLQHLNFIPLNKQHAVYQIERCIEAKLQLLLNTVPPTEAGRFAQKELQEFYLESILKQQETLSSRRLFSCKMEHQEVKSVWL
jgi:hypothetical protein